MPDGKKGGGEEEERREVERGRRGGRWCSELILYLCLLSLEVTHDFLVVPNTLTLYRIIDHLYPFA